MKTPQIPAPKLSKVLGINNEIWLKREDEHYYGSHKGRSIPYMIAEYYKHGIKNFIISSSGNAALAAALAIASHNRNKPDDPLTLKIFVGRNIDKEKLMTIKNIKDKKIIFEQTDNPKQSAFKLNKTGEAKWLRQSTDDIALTGYHELARELSRIKNLSAVFVPTSSGTAAQGIYEGFQRLGVNPQIHIIQTTSCHPMVKKENIKYPISDIQSLATAIVDKIAHRKETVAETIKNSGGFGWIANNEEIIEAKNLIKETTGIDISFNSALSLIGLKKAIESGWHWDGPVVLLITGR